MSKLSLLLLPVLMLQAQESAIPGAVEVRTGVFVLRGVPNERICQGLRIQRITSVVDLRRDDEPNVDCQSESIRMQELGIQYLRYTVGKAPSTSDFDFIRSFLKSQPRSAQVMIHCSDGNRAAAVVCPWLVLEKGLSLEEALKISRNAGLQLPETEDAVRRYVASKGRAS